MIAQFVEAPNVMQKILKVAQTHARPINVKNIRHWNLDQTYVKANDSMDQEYARGEDEEVKDDGNEAVVKFHFTLWEQFVDWLIDLFRL